MHSLAAAVGNKVGKEAEELCASGQCAAAMVALKRAVNLGHLPSRALKAWMLLDGRKGVAKDCIGAFELAEEGARLGCHHCRGVMAFCYWSGCGCEADDVRSLEMARESAGKGSRYEQCALGFLHLDGGGGPEAVDFFRLAAEQGLGLAQYQLGEAYYYGFGVAEDNAEALRWYQLAAAQGDRDGLYSVALFHEHGCSVSSNMAEAFRWYRSAQAAGHPTAAAQCRRLRIDCKKSSSKFPA